MKTAVIIAGGEGSRLKPLTDDRPKTLVEVSGKPILYWIIKWLKLYGIKHIVIGVAYKKERIYDFVKENDNFGVDIDFSEHTVEGGTAQTFNLAIKRFVDDDVFLGMNGDELTNLDIGALESKHMKYKPLITIGLAPFLCRFAVVKTAKDDRIVDFKYGKLLPDVPVSIGVYAMSRALYDYIPQTGSLEDMVLEKLAKKNEVMGYMLSGNEQWTSINTHKDINDAEKLEKQWWKN
jgi:NDP-sugar pyrophosphorylase family protein